MNILTFTTRFGQDAQVRYTPNGKAITTVRCPVEAGWGENRHTSWVTVVIFGERGEKLAPSITKGGKATVSGEFKAREYESNGETRLALEVLMRDIEFHDAPRQAGSDQHSVPRQSQGGQPEYPQTDDFSDDIPFRPLNWRVY